MTREEILKQDAPIEPNCFETDREEQWYKVGLYEGATANPWHSVKDGEIPQVYARCLFNSKAELYKGFMAADKLLYFDDRGNQKLSIDEVDYWMEIPELPK